MVTISVDKNLFLNYSKIISVSWKVIAIILFLFPGASFGQAPNLGTASSFVLFTANGAFTNVGATNATGDVGTNVGAYSAFPPGTLVGTAHVIDATSAQAALDIAAAYNYLSTLGGSVLGVSLAAQTLTPGIYNTGAAASLNGDLTLDGGGDPNALFIIRIGGALTTSTFSNVILTNSANLSNVYWQIGGQFDLGENSVFRGTVLADGIINLLSGSTIYGRSLSRGGAINISAIIAMIPAPPVITTQPANQTECIGNAAGFSVVATGSSLVYQWQVNTAGTWGDITAAGSNPTYSGYTSADLTLTGTVATNNGYKYRVIVTSLPGGAAVLSDVATLTLNPLPTVAITGNATICEDNPSTLTFTLTGTSDWTIQYSDGTTTFSTTGTASPHTLDLTPLITTTYTIISVTDGNSCTKNYP